MTSLVHLYLTKTFVTNSLVLITIYIRFCFDWVYLRIKRERKLKKKNILLFKLQIYFYTTKNVGGKKKRNQVGFIGVTLLVGATIGMGVL